MIRIVESFFESNGDPGRLKCSNLEEYALSLGIEAKAYDFRRNAEVRRRMEELRCSAGTAGFAAIAYKSVDVDALLNRNHTREMLKNSILELDETWRRVYEQAADLSGKNTALLSALAKKEQAVETIASEKDSCEEQIESLKRDLTALTVENRYLRKSLREYLYPAIANEILKREHVLEQADTEILPEAMAALADSGAPLSFSTSVAPDKDAISREEAILKRMEDRIHGKIRT
jgi:chromosome segregation ATPase